MKWFSILLALSFVTLGSAAAVSPFVASDSNCDNVLKNAAGCAGWTLRCVGDALGGQSCHEVAADANVDPKKVIACTGEAARHIIEGTPMEMCEVSMDTAAPDVKQVVDCTKQAVRNFIQGTPQPCPIGYEAEAGNGIVDCAAYFARQIINNRPIMPCPI